MYLYMYVCTRIIILYMSPGIFHPINYDMSHIGSILEKILYLWETLKTNRSKGLDPMLAVEHGSRISLPSYFIIAR